MVEPPPEIFVPPGAGSPPAGAPAIFAPANNAFTGITLSGTSYGSGTLGDRGDPDEDGRHTYSGALAQIYYSGGNWVILSASYGAFKASAALSPVGLTGWTITTGSGQPTITGNTLAKPPAIQN